MLSEARTRAGLSQTELARRAGVAQSVISEYEAGRRQPALPTLSRLISATGHELTMTLERPGMRRMEVLSSGPARLYAVSHIMSISGSSSSSVLRRSANCRSSASAKKTPKMRERSGLKQLRMR